MIGFYEVKMENKYTKELHKKMRNWCNNSMNLNLTSSRVGCLLDEIEKLQKVIYDLKYPKCTCEKCTGTDDYYDYYLLDEGDYL